jgi:hypothetical protein
MADINPGFYFLGAALLLALGFQYYQSRLAAGGSFVAPDDQTWADAVRRARATIPQMLSLHAAGRELWVKFPFTPADGAREHVWGRVIRLSGETLHVTLETPLRGHRGPAPGELTVPFSDLEDWQVELPDRTVRGGYTTRAEIALARREGRRLPPHIADMQPRFRD